MVLKFSVRAAAEGFETNKQKDTRQNTQISTELKTKEHM